jgi:hypothetical protein
MSYRPIPDLSASCFLLSAFCFSAFCLLPFAFCFLPSAFHLIPSDLSNHKNFGFDFGAPLFLG